MAWSTSRLAELAGTTLNTVRHYHRRGLLDEPPRAGNGYKQYGVEHLVRLLQIRRPREPERDGAHGPREHGAITEVPPGFAAVASRLSPAERSLMLVYARIYRAEALGDVRAMLEAETEADPASLAFDALGEDADEETREHLAEQLSAGIERAFDDHPWVADPSAQAKLFQQPPRATAVAMVEVLQSVYRPAQLDVLARASRIAMERTGRPVPALPGTDG